MANGVDPQVLAIALDKASGQEFERFAQALLGALLGADFVPLGGTGDGGADGLLLPYVLENADAPTDFLQVTTQRDDATGKIRGTVTRLREVGREVSDLMFVTSQRLALPDRLELKLSKELGAAIRIRDQSYIHGHINDTPGTSAAFNHLAPSVAFLSKVGGTEFRVTRHVDSPNVYVYLRQELERREGGTTLEDAMVDSLITWALEGTDPDQDILRSSEELETRILDALPALKEIVRRRLTERLEAMADKSYPGGRQVRWHKKEGKFALPHEQRTLLQQENSEDEALRIGVRQGFEDSLQELLPPEVGAGTVTKAALVALQTVEIQFEREGLEFADFVTGQTEAADSATISEAVGDAMRAAGIPPANRVPVGEAVLEVLRQAFYYGSNNQRRYFERLSRTYALLFALQADPRVVKYFEELASDFYLYVGSDILIRALSESYLQDRDRTTHNTLAMAMSAGATLVLTEPVLDEVVAHLRGSDLEFKNYFEEVEPHVTLDVSRQSSKILIRAYFYAKLNEELTDRPRSWKDYVNRICDPVVLHKVAALRDVRTYLEGRFGFTHELRTDLEGMVDEKTLAALTTALMGYKGNVHLARNDALMALSVYGRREALDEHVTTSEFGYRTWWLTSESRILRHTKSIVEMHRGERYMMRPEFLLNFIALSPKATDVRRSYANVFPSALGVQLGRRMDEDAFHKLMGEAREAARLEGGRRQAEIARIIDELKSDFGRSYAVAFQAEPAGQAQLRLS